MKVGREVERGVVDVETLRKVNDELVATIEETIQHPGRRPGAARAGRGRDRRAAERPQAEAPRAAQPGAPDRRPRQRPAARVGAVPRRERRRGLRRSDRSVTWARHAARRRGDLMAEQTSCGSAWSECRGRRGGSGRRPHPLHTRHRPVPHDPGHVGHERVDSHRRQRPRHDRHRRADGDHPLHAGHGQPHGARRQDRQHHGPQAGVRPGLHHLRLRLDDDGALAQPHGAHHRLVVPRGHRRRADHAGHRRTRGRQLRALQAGPRPTASSPPPARSPSPWAR